MAVQREAMQLSLSVGMFPPNRIQPAALTTRKVSEILSEQRVPAPLVSSKRSSNESMDLDVDADMVIPVPLDDDPMAPAISALELPSAVDTLGDSGVPRVSRTMNPQYLNKSMIPRAFALQQQQKFGKDNLNQSFTCDKAFPHVILPLYKSKFLTKADLKCLWEVFPPTRRLWTEWKRVKSLPFWELNQPNPNWKDQEKIDPRRVDLRMALLLHYNMDLAAVQRFIGQEHVGAHRDPDVILPRVKHLIPPDMYIHLKRILQFGCPAMFNAHGEREQFLAYRDYGNHPSVSRELEAFRKTMNKEDKREHVLTFPAFLLDFIPDLWLTPQGMVCLPNKNPRVVFNASFQLYAHIQVYNQMVSNDYEPDIIFAGALMRYLTIIYNLRITYPNSEIYPFDDDVSSAFRKTKYNPNVISAKAYRGDGYLYIPTGSTFGDTQSPSSFEPFACARTALATDYCSGLEDIPEYEEYLNAVEFAPPPDESVQFVPARPDRFNQGVLDASGKPKPTEYNMHVDDNMYAAASEQALRWAMRCSIHALNFMMGGSDPALRPNPVDFDKFVRELIGHRRRQVGYIIDTRLLAVSIPDDKQASMLDLLRTTWGQHRRSFTLNEAACLLGTLVSMCRVCSWGIFLFTNLYHAIYEMLRANTRRLWSTPEFRELIRQRDEASRHATDSSRFRFFSSKVAKTIWDSRSRTFISVDIRRELDFVTTVFSDPVTYNWSSPIAHLIELEPDYEGWQDACLTGGGGLSFALKYWWIVEWPQSITCRTIRHLPQGDPSLISINLLEYACIIIGLAASDCCLGTTATRDSTTTPNGTPLDR